MLKIPTKASVMISIVLSILFMLILIVAAGLMPWLVEVFIDIKDISGDRNNLTELERVFVFVLAYGALFLMALADGMLLTLLFRVRSELVFTPKSVSLIRGVSWCAVLLGIVFALLGRYFQLAYFVAFACVFLGLCLRVVKNVIKQATEIKSKHDYTI